MRRTRRKMALAVVTAMLATAGLAYMASGGVSPSSAGEGSGHVHVTTSHTVVSVTSTTIPVP